MHIPPFKIERFFARYEFSAPYLLSCSDCEPMMLNELLQLADNELLALWHNLRLAYTESQGHPLLRQEIARLYETISSEEVLEVIPIEGIFLAMNVLLNKGDHVIVTFPGYQSLYQVAESLGCEVSLWKPDESKGWYFDIAKMASLIQKNTKVLIINFPHNPTGALISHKQLEDIIEIARKHNLFIFSDEMYRFLEYNSQDRLPSVSDRYENCISLFGMSKTFALPGLRVGWLSTKNKEVFKNLKTFKDYTSICQSAPSEILAIMGLRAKEKLIARNLTIIQENTAACDAFFKKYSQIFSWQPPKASSIAFARFLPGQVTSWSNQIREKDGIIIVPSTIFDYGDEHFRIGLGRKDLPFVLGKLEERLLESS